MISDGCHGVVLKRRARSVAESAAAFQAAEARCTEEAAQRLAAEAAAEAAAAERHEMEVEWVRMWKLVDGIED